MTKNYVKVIGLKFDAIEGIDVVQDANRQNITDAAKFAERHDDHNTLWLVVPCSYTMSRIVKD